MHAYNKDMKNHFKAIVITLLVILCIFTGLSGAALFGLQRQVSSLTASFVNPSDEPSEKGEVTLSAPQTLTRFYRTLVSELNEYGDPAKTQEASARLLTQVFVKTMKDCTVRTIEYKPDGLEIEIQGVCVPFDQIDSSLASSVLYSSLGRYAMSHPVNSAMAIFGSTENFKSTVYGDFVNFYLEDLKNAIMKLDAEPVYYTIDVSIDAEGNWKIRTIDTQEGTSLSQDAASSQTVNPDADSDASKK